MKHQRGVTTLELIIVILFLLSAGGWIANIVKLSHSSFDPITVLTGLRVVGIFVPPMGAVLGYF